MDNTSGTRKLIGTYLASEMDREEWANGDHPPEQIFPSDLSGNTVDYFINGTAYFTALDDEIKTLCASKERGRFLYLSAWWLGLSPVSAATEIRALGEMGAAVARQFPVLKDVTLPVKVGTDLPPMILPSGEPLSTRLKELHDSGADVRILAWVSPFAARYAVPELEGIRVVNAQTLLSVAEMRKHFGDQGAGNVLLNLAAHPMGAAHCKLVVAGDRKSTRAFTGGIDPVENRKAKYWHDLAVRVTGPGATAIHRFFQQLWAENLGLPVETFQIGGQQIPSRLTSAGKIPDLAAKPAGTGTGAHVQVLRTVPCMRFTTAGPAWIFEKSAVVRALIAAGIGFQKQPISFAKDGLFEFKVALEKAIRKAEKYIFIADQGFTSQEIMGWINARLRQRPQLKVILLHGSDPADPPTGDLAHAVNEHLIPGVPPLLLDSSSGLQGLEFRGWTNTTVHCKVTIIDDVFCIVGSANSMRRSLYTDIELSVAILDAAGTDTVRRLRRDLWAKYCGMALPEEMPLIAFEQKGYDELLDIDNALSLWCRAWGGALPPGVALLPAIKGFQLPMPVTAPYSPESHDRQDPDSRTPV
ncbi:phospholipase D family protein [Actinomadura sp. GTD37]|uniref:phospholipase D family protein n=1 Tax=Actinomadura sp. GTD37 TaxID=1778030 RepID=UPI0035C26100